MKIEECIHFWSVGSRVCAVTFLTAHGNTGKDGRRYMVDMLSDEVVPKGSPIPDRLKKELSFRIKQSIIADIEQDMLIEG